MGPQANQRTLERSGRPTVARKRLDPAVEDDQPSASEREWTHAEHETSATDTSTVQRSSTSTPDSDSANRIESSPGRVAYDAGPDRSRLADRYGVDFVRGGQAAKLQRLEDEHGSECVQRWVEEGMTVETMGKPLDMRAFRERQESRPAAVPADVERQNQASYQRNATGVDESGPAGDVGVSASVRSVVSSPGQSMDESVQREMESKMGGDFSDVRIHTGAQASAAAESINARAFTVGNHVAFNDGEYRPESTQGKEVLAHELTHVRQQTDGAVSMLPKEARADSTGSVHVGAGLHVQPALEVSSPDDPAEKEAEQVATQVVQMDRDEGTQTAERGTDSLGSASAGQTVTNTALTGSGGGERVDRFVSSVGSAVKDAASSVGSGLKSLGSSVAERTSNAVDAISDGISSAGSHVWEALEKGGRRAWDALREQPQALAEMVKNGGRRAWSILEDGADQLWSVIREGGSEIWDAIERRGRRFWSMLRRNMGLLEEMIREGGRRVWSFIESHARYFWHVLPDAPKDVILALYRAGRRFTHFIRRGIDRFDRFLQTVGEYAMYFLETFSQQFWYYLRTFPERLLRAGREFYHGDKREFFGWLWDGIKQLFSDPSGMEEWLASGAEGDGGPARMLSSLVDLLPAAEAWTAISTMFRDGRQPTSDERNEVRPIIGDTVEYDSVRIVEDSSLAPEAFVTGHVINLPSNKSNPRPGTSEMKTLVHEFLHVGQYEALGTRYIPEAIHAQHSDIGYDFYLTDLEDESFSYFNREQQASIAGDLYGHIYNDLDGSGANLLIDRQIEHDGEIIITLDDFFEYYDELYARSECPYRRQIFQDYRAGIL